MSKILKVLERIEDLLNIKNGYFIIFLLIAFDLVSKYLAEQYLVFGQAIPLNSIIDMLLVYNSGIAFSIFDVNNWIVSLVFIGFCDGSLVVVFCV